MSTVEEMLEEGWCASCDGDPTECMRLGYCKIEMEALNG